ncbi:MAG: MFS transporter [Firmicutes bacterium]|nr:MFS transporter [Bacillota bacterium]
MPKHSGQKQNSHTLAWIMWSILALAFLIGYFHRLSLAVVMDYLILDFKIEDAAVAGSLAAIYALVYMIMQIPTGLLADSWGTRKTVTAGMLVASGGSFIFALAPNIFYAFLGRGLVALGVSVVFVCILKFQLNWFKPAQFATITGLTGLISNLGVVLGTTPLSLLVVSSGWRNSFLIIAAVTFITALACWLVVRDSPEEIQKGERLSATQTVNFRQLWEALKNVLKNYRNFLLIAGTFGIYGILIAFTGTWSITYLMQIYGFSRSVAANFILMATIGMCIGFPLIGFISDKLRRRKQPLLLLFLLQAVIWCLFFLWNGGKPPENALYILFFIMGITAGASALVIAIAKEINDPSFSGTALSVANTGAFLGMSIMQPLLGYILDLRWNGVVVEGTKIYPLAAYRGLFAACLAFLAVCLFCTLFIKETYCQNIYLQDNKSSPANSSQNIFAE